MEPFMIHAHATATFKRLKRLPMHTAIRSLVSWKPLEDPEDGFTVVIACMKALSSVAIANLRLVQEQNAPSLKRIILVYDCTTEELPDDVLAATDSSSDSLPVDVLCYNRNQAGVSHRINWGWVYSWMSWCIGIAHAETRHVLIHDLDAMPIDQTLFEGLYQSAVESGSQWSGIRQYSGNGVTRDMNLVTTFELVCDAQYIRGNFAPFDGFNKPRVLDGIYVDFDTFLYMQHMSPLRSTSPTSETSLVHPSQLICDYTEFTSGRSTLEHRQHSLIFLLYLKYIAGEKEPLLAATERLKDMASRDIVFENKPLPIHHLKEEHWAWTEKQIRRLEQARNQRTRPEIEEYLEGMILRAGDKRTVGKEQGESAVMPV